MCDRNGAVAVFHGRVNLGPRLRGFAQLEARLVGQANGPRGAQEGDLLGIHPALGDFALECALSVICGARNIVSEAVAEVGQSGGGKTSLDDGLFVCEVQNDLFVSEGGCRTVANSGDQDVGNTAFFQAAQNVDDFGCRA